LASHREAVAQFQRALRFAAGMEPDVVAGLYDGLADELKLVDRGQEAAEACERALGLWHDAGDRLREGDALRRLSRMLWDLCRNGEAFAAAEAAVSVLEPLGSSVELAWAYATSATLRMLSSQNATAADLAVRAQQIAEQLGALDVLSDALNTQAVCAANRGADWSALMDRALEVALSGGFPKQAARAYQNSCHFYSSMRQFGKVEKYLTAGIGYCDEHDLIFSATCLRSELADVLERTGRWERSVALSTEILDSARATPISQLCSLTRIGLIRARRSEPGSWEYLDKANIAADAAGQTYQMVSIHLARAEAYWLEGKLSEAAHEAERASDVVTGCEAWTRGAVAVWLTRTGSARSPSGDVAEPHELELDGRRTQAAQIWTELGCPYDAAMALTGAWDAETLNQAFKTFDSLGVFPAARMIREKLRLIGAPSLPARPQAATRAHPVGLTQREHEVLALISAALTNDEIAVRLAISSKTVENHVTAVLKKMGARNRTAAAQRAAQLGLINPK
jgi:DNA-binding CsgD family transcriptional regulator/tetratricopeptide (TPR) repeat protein